MDGRGDRTGNRENMDCHRAADLVPWVAASSAPAGERAWLYRHVAGCPACRTDLARAIALAARVRHAARSLPAAPPQVWERLAAVLPPEPVSAEDQRDVVLLGKALGVLEQAGLPQLALAPLRWVLGWA